MSRISPVEEAAAPAASRELAAAHLAAGGRMTNMKWTLARAPVALDALLQWYPLYDEVVPFLGERRTHIFCHAISTQADCVICSTYFRRALIEAGEDPDALELDELDELIADLGRRLAADAHTVDDAMHAALRERFDEAQVVLLFAFGAIMLATNVFNDGMGVPVDDSLQPYRA